MSNKLQHWVEERWYAANPAGLKLLLPLEKLYLTLFKRREKAYRSGKKIAYRPSVPVIIVGNIHVGGSGKSPLVAALAKHFASLGYKPGIVSRGYGGKANYYPQSVTIHSDPQQVGDEPLMLAQQTGLPIAVDPKRPNAVKLLIEEEGCDLIIADDGLQHLALGRDIEIVVIDAARGIGNGHCLPVGPLREPPSRLNSVDWVIFQQVSQHGNQQADQATSAELESTVLKNIALKNPLQNYVLEFSGWRRGDGHWQKDCPFSQGETVHALAGIGNPPRFFNQLKSLGLTVIEHPLVDHAQLTQQHLEFNDDKPLVMTAKDAVKLQPWLNQRHWVAEVTANLPEAFLYQLQNQVADINKQHLITST